MSLTATEPPDLPAFVVTITTDGSCYPNDGNGNMGWAAIIKWPKLPERAAQIVTGCERGGVVFTSNNRAEFQAVLTGLRALDSRVRHAVTIRTDSQYVLNACSRWCEGWAARGWRTATDEPVKNRDLIEAIMEQLELHDVTWTFVKGHAGDVENEQCDQLAMKARQSLNHT